MKLKDIHESFTNLVYDGYGWREPQYEEKVKPKKVKEQKKKPTKKK